MSNDVPSPYSHFGITGSAILLGNQVAFEDARFSFLGNLAGVAVVAVGARSEVCV